MKYVILLAAVGLAATALEFESHQPPGGVVIAERPVVNVPPTDRQENWTYRNPQNGSCVHASFLTLLRWQGRRDFAEYWRSRYPGGGESAGTFGAKLDAEGVRYAVTTNGDVGFLEWACRTRRGACVTSHRGNHMETLVHLDHESAALIDNNFPGKFRWLPREQFLREWRDGQNGPLTGNGGWAFTPIYTPAAPLPQ